MQDKVVDLIVIMLVVSTISMIISLCFVLSGYSYTECAVCGAHVIDHWSIMDMYGTEKIDVCQFCYRDICY